VASVAPERVGAPHLAVDLGGLRGVGVDKGADAAFTGRARRLSGEGFAQQLA